MNIKAYDFSYDPMFFIKLLGYRGHTMSRAQRVLGTALFGDEQLRFWRHTENNHIVGPYATLEDALNAHLDQALSGCVDFEYATEEDYR